jgi:MFS family permease
VDENLGFYLLPILNAGSTFGRIMPNYIADHWGPMNLFTPAAGITAVLAFCWIAVNSTAGIVILALLYGFFSGGFVSLPPVVMAVITEDFRSFGTRLGMLFAIVSLALLVGTPIGGAILGDASSYLGLQLFSGACLVSASVISIILRVKRSGPRLLYKT